MNYFAMAAGEAGRYRDAVIAATSRTSTVCVERARPHPTTAEKVHSSQTLLMRCCYLIEPDGTLIVRSIDDGSEQLRLRAEQYISARTLDPNEETR